MEWYWILVIVLAVVGLAVCLGVGLGVKKNGNNGGGGKSFQPFPDYDSPCFKESADAGIPIEDQDAVSGHPASIQIVNSSKEDLWINWTCGGSLSSDVPTMWSSELDQAGIKNYMWKNDSTHSMGVFKLAAGSYVVLAYIGNSVRIAALMDCKDAQFTDQESIKENCQVGVYPQTLVEWTYTPSGTDVIDSSFVDGFTLPVRIEYLTESGKYNTILGKLTEQGCEEGKGGKIESAGKYGGCKSPCAATGRDDACCAGAYDTPEKCHPGGVPVAEDVLDPWCNSISNMFSIDGKRLGYCYSYDDEAGSIVDHERTNSRIKVIWCADGFT